MVKMILIPLTIMLLLNIFALSAPTGYTSTSQSGSNSIFSAGGSNTLFGLNFSTFDVVVVIGILIIIAIAVSVNILGTGISAGGTRIILVLVGTLTLWGFLSLSGLPVLNALPLGLLIFIGLTLMYLVGVLQMVSGLSEGG